MSDENESDRVDRLRAQWARELPDIDTEPMAILGRALRLRLMVNGSIEETFAEFGIDRGEFDVIATLRRAGPPYRLTPTDMYSTLMISSGGLTHRLDRLTKAGLIRREKSQKDGRSIEVVLTDKGRALAEAAFRKDMASEMQFLRHLTREERDLLSGLLRKLLAGLERESPDLAAK
jgi:DNA-binding MarR family transcriptional regulator